MSYFILSDCYISHTLNREKIGLTLRVVEELFFRYVIVAHTDATLSSVGTVRAVVSARL